jgi:rhamnulokinase
VHSTDWSRAALDYFRLPSQWFSRPILAGTKLGRLKKEIAGRSPGARRDRVIAVPGHDTACAYDAMPASPDGTDLFLSSGTWSARRI